MNLKSIVFLLGLLIISTIAGILFTFLSLMIKLPEPKVSGQIVGGAPFKWLLVTDCPELCNTTIFRPEFFFDIAFWTFLTCLIILLFYFLKKTNNGMS
jgi:hypothetical protein